MGVTYDRIGGNVTAVNAQGVLIQAVAIGGSASVLGGGGGVLGGPPESGGCFAAPIPAPWSDDNALSNPNTGTPRYTDFEDSTIGGNLSVTGVQTCWIGSLRDQVGGSVNFSGDTTSDPDGMELGSNVIGGNMTCLANLPAVQFGDSNAASNVVGGSATGQCGFNVMPVDPAANPDNGFNTPPYYPAGPPTHISVPASSLGNYPGAHVQDTTMGTVPYGTTASGDTLTLTMNTVDLTGMGITGTSIPETVGATVYPDGSDSFFAKDQCSPCSFDGQSGALTIVAYGTTSASGVTTGRFLVASGGANGGALGGLAGYGTFSSAGQPLGTLRLAGHLVLG
jgi:hypothetical protein